MAAIAILVVLTGSKSPSPKGTQSDPNVGSSKYLAPKHANQPPEHSRVNDPDSIPALSKPYVTCPWADSNSTHPSLQDNGQGATSYADMPESADSNTVRCAIARAKAAGYTVANDSVQCQEQTVELLDPASNKLWSFQPFCVYVGASDGPTCSVTLIPTDYQGNFIRQDEPDLKRLQDFLAQAVVDEDPSGYGSC